MRSSETNGSFGSRSVEVTTHGFVVSVRENPPLGAGDAASVAHNFGIPRPTRQGRYHPGACCDVTHYVSEHKGAVTGKNHR